MNQFRYSPSHHPHKVEILPRSLIVSLPKLIYIYAPLSVLRERLHSLGLLAKGSLTIAMLSHHFIHLMLYYSMARH